MKMHFFLIEWLNRTIQINYRLSVCTYTEVTTHMRCASLFISFKENLKLFFFESVEFNTWLRWFNCLDSISIGYNLISLDFVCPSLTPIFLEQYISNLPTIARWRDQKDIEYGLNEIGRRLTLDELIRKTSYRSINCINDIETRSNHLIDSNSKWIILVRWMIDLIDS